MNTDKMFKSTNMKKPLLINEIRSKVGGLSVRKWMASFGLTALFIIVLGWSGVQAQTLSIQGDSSVCPGQLADYAAINMTMGGTLNWSLPNGGGSITGPSNQPTVFIQWGGTPGRYTLRLNEASQLGNNTVFFQVEIEGNPSVSCNNLVQVSVDSDCQAVIEPDMVLEGPSYADDSYNVIVFDGNGKVIPNATVTGKHIGQTFNVTVTHLCTGSTCWGRIKIEDKWIPELLCHTDTVTCGEDTSPEAIGYPVDPTSTTITPKGDNGNEFTVLNWDKCGPIHLRYIDQKQNKTCEDEFYSVIYRFWTAYDEAGNQTSCVDTIMVERGNVDNVIFPPNFDNIANPYLECNAKTPQDPSFFVFPWNALPNGYPSPYDFRDMNGNVIYFGTGYPSGTECDHLATTFTDVKIDVCGGTYKILRKWRVLDWCSGAIREGDQLIKIVDEIPPIVACPPIDTVGTDYYTCTGTGKVLHPTVFEECSNWSYTILHKPDDGTGNPDPSKATDKNVVLGKDGHYYINDLPIGRSWIVYKISDECGNTTECVTEIDVLDDDNPVAVCDEHTVVTLNEYGKAEIYATSVDQGSFDNCELDSFGIRRMTTNCGVASDLNFGPKVQLCCEDVTASPIMVVFRVWDKAGNYNDCMVEVTVQDKLAPKLTCPPNITIDCDLDYTNLDTTGYPVVLDECGDPDVTFVDNLSGLNDCNIGVIRRRFTAVDESGRFSVCDQSITLVNRRPFGIRDITWPRNNITVNGCSAIDADPSVAGRPTYTNRECVKIAASYHDDVFTDVQDICLKIVRTWNVIDWCQYDVNNPQSTAGKWTFFQTIFVDNNVAPDLDICDELTICADRPDCSALVQLEQFGSDDCTDDRDLEWRFEIDYNNDGTIDTVGYSNEATDVYPIGSHEINWYATDECGNTGTCSQLFNVVDCKEPTPYCEPGIITVIMPSTGEIEIWANDFDAGSFDNCTPNEKLKFSFSADTSDTGRLFNCDSLDGEMEMRFTVMVWVTDEAGNQDFCTTNVIIQANPSSCPNIRVPINISGLIQTTYNKNCADVEVDLSQDNFAMSTVFTTPDGRYLAANLEQGHMYEMRPRSNQDILQNVSTADLVRIQKHILGIESIKSPFGVIAADINNSNSISAKDLVALRRVILGVDNQFPNNNSWRFIDANHTFEDATNPWPFPESIAMDTLTRDYDQADFIAVKIGDVSGNSGYRQGELETRNKVSTTFTIRDQYVTEGSIVEVPVYLDEEDALEGIQFTLDLGTGLDLAALSAGTMSVSDENLAWIDPANGLFTFVWFDAANPVKSKNQPVFTLKLIAKRNGMVSNSLQMNSRVIQASAVLSGEEGPLSLNFRASLDIGKNNKLIVGQNYPNPFGDNTVIPFYTPNSGMVTFSIFDLSGKKLMERIFYADKGDNEITILKSDLNGAGILYYQVSTSEDSATKRMIVLD